MQKERRHQEIVFVLQLVKPRKYEAEPGDWDVKSSDTSECRAVVYIPPVEGPGTVQNKPVMNRRSTNYGVTCVGREPAPVCSSGHISTRHTLSAGHLNTVDKMPDSANRKSSAKGAQSALRQGDNVAQS